jgi:hypothetical protein
MFYAKQGGQRHGGGIEKLIDDEGYRGQMVPVDKIRFIFNFKQSGAEIVYVYRELDTQFIKKVSINIVTMRLRVTYGTYNKIARKHRILTIKL